MIERSDSGSPQLEIAKDDEFEAAGLCTVERRKDGGSVLLKNSPAICLEDDQGQLSTGQVLLIREILVACHQDSETGSFCSSQQVPILELGPAHLIGGFYLVTGK